VAVLLQVGTFEVIQLEKEGEYSCSRVAIVREPKAKQRYMERTQQPHSLPSSTYHVRAQYNYTPLVLEVNQGI